MGNKREHEDKPEQQKKMKKEKTEDKKEKKREDKKERKKEDKKERKKEDKKERKTERETPVLSNVQEFRELHSIKVEGDLDVQPILSFNELDLSKNIMYGLKDYEKPTPIQSECWPVALKGRDVIGIAMTGSGKSMAFGVPLLNHLLRNSMPFNSGLVLAPTRELAIQIHQCLEKAGEKMELSSICVYGGVPKENDRQAFRKRKFHLIVATPGRLMDLMEEGIVKLDKISFLVLDEADRMLDLGFINAMRTIIGATPSNRQTVMFSATWPMSVRNLAQEFLCDPVKISIGSDELTSNKNVTQIVEVLENPRDKEQKLVQLLSKYHSSRSNRVLIFALYKKEVDRIEEFLLRKGFKVKAIHGDKRQCDRTAAIESFRSGEFPLLIATDVAARGLDIPNVEYVINHTFPLTIEEYTHRIGRCGRAGKTGISHTLFTPFDKAHSGELINTLKVAGQNVPPELLKFGTTVKKKEHKDYGAFYKEMDPNAKSSHVKFD